MEYEAKITEYTVKPVEEQTFSINATIIRIADEGAGEFITLSQETDTRESIIAVEKEDWELIKGVVDAMMKTVEAGK
jgi:hypothetical protein